jgi:hypothetical protein
MPQRADQLHGLGSLVITQATIVAFGVRSHNETIDPIDE